MLSGRDILFNCNITYLKEVQWINPILYKVLWFLLLVVWKHILPPASFSILNYGQTKRKQETWIIHLDIKTSSKTHFSSISFSFQSINTCLVNLYPPYWDCTTLCLSFPLLPSFTLVFPNQSHYPQRDAEPQQKVNKERRRRRKGRNDGRMHLKQRRMNRERHMDSDDTVTNSWATQTRKAGRLAPLYATAHFHTGSGQWTLHCIWAAPPSHVGTASPLPNI